MGKRCIIVTDGPFQKAFEVKSNYTYVLQVNGSYKSSTNTTTYTVQLLCHQDKDSTNGSVTQNILPPISLKVNIKDKQYPICVELPDANYWGDPRDMLEYQTNREIQLINPATNEAMTNFSSIFKLYDIVVETQPLPQSATATGSNQTSIQAPNAT